MNSQRQKRLKAGQRGNAIIETTLLMPWILFLFMGVFDFGFYAYALIATENAARVAALSAASTNSPGLTCEYALGELRVLPNVGPLLAPPCPASPTATFPVAVVATLVPSGIDADASHTRPAWRVTVSYLTIPVFPLPWMAGRMTMTRTAEMRVNQD
jgi:hypothetical protein